MVRINRCLLSLLVGLSCAEFASGQGVPQKTPVSQLTEACPYFPPGSVVAEPPERRSTNGKLRVALTIRSSVDPLGHHRYCYFDEQGNLAPTLRLHPGDSLILTLKNEISPTSEEASLARNHRSGNRTQPHSQHDPCSGGRMDSSSTNLHFHGLSVPPVCHQDDTLNTLIQPGDPPFEYRIQIPKDQPPGLYWYHPHVHGFSEEQILGGASGALVIEGVEQVDPKLQGLLERVFVIRDALPSDVPSSAGLFPNKPTKELSLNYVPVPYPNYPRAVIKIKPSERQLWRVLNAAADTYLDLRVLFDGTPQFLTVVSLDGVPLDLRSPGSKEHPRQSSIFLPPASRAEFVLIGPPQGVTGLLETNFVNRGAGDDSGSRIVPVQPGIRAGQDDLDPARPLATLLPSSDDEWLPVVGTSGSVTDPLVRVSPPVAAVTPTRKRTLYFSESLTDPADPSSATLFFITEEGRTPAVFQSHREPDIVVHVGEVEDWTIENRSQESHAFHMHQLHFLLVGAIGVPWDGPAERDTINLPAWRGLGRFPSVTLRMDFRNPAIIGTFPFHCHILQHSDGGMMGTVRVESAVANKN